ncbi:MAG: Cobyrinic acid ac-diamide synthase [Deferribacteraceae bacterium]|jgi:flagellar biosynthesis protein FlhG|nr:Cobyrinic acid ac-diamide synthase [Deferribacteraceae bacterium]
MADQAQNLRKIAWEKKKKAKYITVSSGKGGVGKTNFSVNFACLLAKNGKKVLLFDADLGLANVDILLNITPKISIIDYFEKNLNPDQLIVNTAYGFDIIPASSGFSKLASMNEEDFNKLIDIFVYIDDIYEYIIFDAGAGISENVMKFVSISDINIILTQAEPTAITDAYALIKVANNQYGLDEANIVINRINDEKAAFNLFLNLQKIIDKFLKIKTNFLGYIREDTNIIKSVKKQTPLAALNPLSGYMKDLAAIIKKIDGIDIDIQKSGVSIKDILRRLVS